MSKNNNVLASLNYFGIFFAPFLFPLVMMLVTKDDKVRFHAKRAILSHSLILIIIIVVMGLSTIFYLFHPAKLTAGVLVIGYLVASVISVILFIWNVVQGVEAVTSNNIAR
ncbi:DUF4870 domain-containing protein [Virgibacillus sp. NKC19-3]|uniref:DUF4870 domain-containing protein n=1 Tax=Virgibacillus saliphilus TaxID=2831674 RepID=UPI001C9A8573|nr:DUF4870 domain-containing protein [Virgibacillus sp. NKC19-3]MBY7141545.1 DUF4870 domain-containing protein [Virgibacillus sp. NKC19-3]